MRRIAFAASLLLYGPAHAADCVIRVGYPDRERPPYYLGHGTVVPEPAGAGVDLIRTAVRQAGCTAQLTRLPTARLKFALIDGSVDMAPVDLRDGEQPYSALPMNVDAAPDTQRGIRVTAVVYVRVADGVAANTNPRLYFRTHALAVTQGTPLSEQLRDEGYAIDGGAADTYSNLDKLELKRVDGFAISIVNADAMDALVAARYAGRLVRLAVPMRASTLWLSSSNAYYRAHNAQIEQLWNWWGDNAARKLGEFVKTYGSGK
jgi:hypothetical protein